MQHVSPSPSKIPYVGFSPVRLQTGIQPRPSPTTRGLSTRPAYTNATLTYTWLKLRSPSTVVLYRTSLCRFLRTNRLGFWQPRRTSPEALGSPAGYVVPPGQCLLWPHPKLSTPPSDLCIRRWVFALRPRMGWNREAPQFTLHDCSPVPTSIPRRTKRLHGCCFTACSSLRRYPSGSASALSLSRLQSSLYATARTIAGPPYENFYFRASTSRVTPRKRRV